MSKIGVRADDLGRNPHTLPVTLSSGESSASVPLKLKIKPVDFGQSAPNDTKIFSTFSDDAGLFGF